MKKKRKLAESDSGTSGFWRKDLPATESDLIPFEDYNKNYINEGLNQYTLQFLREMTRSNKIPSLLKNKDLLSKLVEITKVLHLNELEIAVWSLVLDSLEWSQPGIGRETFLFVIAFQAKQYFHHKKEMGVYLSLIHICRCRRIERCRSRWSPYH
eukprot:TRINITY_DN2428_c0_g2_i3.p1 TRINITY_DN2428_c0_g2~~TRINITY_DN2428_c0_g2_i3.p1  ORF type:complete len:155 (-),score=34.86 TRINITY_DN2428_c0_g2_i3:22-486(-)